MPIFGPGGGGGGTTLDFSGDTGAGDTPSVGVIFEGVNGASVNVDPDGTSARVQIDGGAGAIPAASPTVTGPDAAGDAPALGVSGTFSDGDHDHGLPAPSGTVTGPAAFGDAPAAGAAGTYSDGGHSHGLPVAPTAIGTINATAAIIDCANGPGYIDVTKCLSGTLAIVYVPPATQYLQPFWVVDGANVPLDNGWQFGLCPVDMLDTNLAVSTSNDAPISWRSDDDSTNSTDAGDPGRGGPYLYTAANLIGYLSMVAGPFAARPAVYIAPYAGLTPYLSTAGAVQTTAWIIETFGGIDNVWVCTTAGTTGAVAPTFDPGASPITDGTAVWTFVAAAPTVGRAHPMTSAYAPVSAAPAVYEGIRVKTVDVAYTDFAEGPIGAYAESAPPIYTLQPGETLLAITGRVTTAFDDTGMGTITLSDATGAAGPFPYAQFGLDLPTAVGGFVGVIDQTTTNGVQLTGGLEVEAVTGDIVPVASLWNGDGTQGAVRFRLVIADAP